MWTLKRKVTQSVVAPEDYGVTGSWGNSALVVSVVQPSGSTGISFNWGSLNDGTIRPAKPDWWRCDGCGHAVPWQANGQAQVVCPHCGGQLPVRYDH